MSNCITNLFNIRYPLIQGGMIWCSGWELASAVSNSGGLGLIGAGSMTPEILEGHILKCKKATKNPFGVNLPLIYPYVEQHIEVLLRNEVTIVFTSAGNPSKWTPYLKSHGITVAHVVASSKSAMKCNDAGVDAIVAEGFEAGGHNGKEETTTFALIPAVRSVTKLPLIAAGGIGSGRAMLAAMVLGADGVQIGSRFAVSVESSAHTAFKQLVVDAVEGETRLSLKQIVPVRLLKNPFFEKIREKEESGATVEELKDFLGKGRAKSGMFLGDLIEGELEIGQVSSMINSIVPASEILEEIMDEYRIALNEIRQMESSRF
ncbi:MAG: nitronate monooxygenase [Bacteroidota bacterium]